LLLGDLAHASTAHGKLMMWVVNKTVKVIDGVPFFWRSFVPEIRSGILRTLDSAMLTRGPKVAEFEKLFSSYIGNDCAATSSCTAALHLTLSAYGIGPGQEVIVPAMTFAATALAVLHAGATPIIVDVDPETGLITDEIISKSVTERTTAVVVVHLYGQMCDMRKISEVTRAKGLLLIEDAAHALESKRDGVRPGELSDGACFSFYTTKSITSGEGGALVSKNSDVVSKVRRQSVHGMDKTAADRAISGYSHWDIQEVGWKYNMNDMQASMLIPQIPYIEENLIARKKIYLLYQSRIEKNWKVTFVKDELGQMDVHAYHLRTLWVSRQTRVKLIDFLNKKKIGSGVHYRPIHQITALNNFRTQDLINSEQIGEKTLSLPLFPEMTLEQVEFTIDILRQFFEQVDKC
jgi:UDP-4-amino-4-deoxy-L-arabinose-oxoglutarate aminotransferase